MTCVAENVEEIQGDNSALLTKAKDFIQRVIFNGAACYGNLLVCLANTSLTSVWECQDVHADCCLLSSFIHNSFQLSPKFATKGQWLGAHSGNIMSTPHVVQAFLSISLPTGFFLYLLRNLWSLTKTTSFPALCKLLMSSAILKSSVIFLLCFLWQKNLKTYYHILIKANDTDILLHLFLQLSFLSNWSSVTPQILLVFQRTDPTLKYFESLLWHELLHEYGSLPASVGVHYITKMNSHE